jgi:hypothetical protein
VEDEENLNIYSQVLENGDLREEEKLVLSLSENICAAIITAWC